jgi:hypothetical protein
MAPRTRRARTPRVASGRELGSALARHYSELPVDEDDDIDQGDEGDPIVANNAPAPTPYAGIYDRPRRGGP